MVKFFVSLSYTMGGGLMQLVAFGAQDVYLTGNAQITFFKVVYRRHTNFAMEMNTLAIDLAKPSGSFNVQILRNGDLVTRMYLHLTTAQILGNNLNATTTPVDVTDKQALIDNTKFAFVRRLGHAVIKECKVQVGGTDIDEHFGIWLDLWYELTHTEGQTVGYNKMIGDVPELTTLRSANIVSDVVIDNYDLYIPLQFWFNRNPGLALPLIALQYHDVRVSFQMQDMAKLYVWSGETKPSLSGWTFDFAELMVDYIYLDADERRRFAQVGHEYLIEQLQTWNNTPNAGKNNFIPQFNHPCKEFVFVNSCAIYNGDNLSTFLCYASDGNWQNALDYAAANVLCGAILLPRNSRDDLSSMINGDVTVHLEEMGVVNNGQTGSIQLTYTTPTNNLPVTLAISVRNDSDSNYDATAVTFELDTSALQYGTGSNTFNYFDTLCRTVSRPYATCVINLVVPSAADNVGGKTLYLDDAVAVGHGLNIRHASVPIAGMTRDQRVSSDSAQSLDINVVQPFNYGCFLDGTGNVVQSGQIKLNGQNRFDLVTGDYFNYVQPWQHHTRTPATGVNVYSFALTPETHQPSGTANLSRIDTTELYATLVVPTTAVLDLTGPTYAGLFTGSTFWILTPNYNVFRIMSGMGGLAYSN